MSRSPSGSAAAGRSGIHGVDLSADGSLLVFDSDAGDLVRGDENRRSDIFLMPTGWVEGGITGCDPLEDLHPLRLSAGPTKAGADGPSRTPRISADGKWVTYTTYATNLLPGKDMPFGDIVLHDVSTGQAQLVSRGLDGEQGTGTSSAPDVSDDGRFVVYQSWADNLVSQDANGLCDIFLFDRTSGETTLVSQGAGLQGGSSTHPSISGDGRFISFASDRSDLVADDANGTGDVFVFDRQTGVIERINVGPGGVEANASGGLFPQSSLSRNGRYVAFLSLADNLVADNPVSDASHAIVEQVFLRDRVLGTTEQVSLSFTGEAADDRCFSPTISGDGRFVGFQSLARNLNPKDCDTVADAYLLDRQAHTLRLLSAPQVSGGERGDSNLVALSPDGDMVAFSSRASDLAQDDENEVDDVFLKSL